MSSLSSPARADTATSARRVWEGFQAQAEGRFFAGAAEATSGALFAEQDPAARERVIATAEDVLRGRFDLLGYRGLDFGDPVDWHLDPVSGRRAPRVHWSALDPTDAASVGDSKVVWELNRQQFLVTLGLAYRATGDERYAQGFARLVQHWLRANPPGLGINWASSLEAALRVVAWCWALALFRTSARLTPALFGEVLASIEAHAAHVERYLSRHFSPNTHLTGEALGLLYAGTVFPELAAAARWRSQGREILEGEIERQVLPDGVYFEQATAYQRYTAEIYLHYLMLAARNRLPVSVGAGDRVQRTLDALLALSRPDGSLPAIGDADGGCLLPLVPRGPEDLRGVFAAAAAFFGRSDYAWAARGPQPETLWLLGAEGTATFARLLPAPPARSASRVLEDGGYVVMRADWSADAHQLVLDAGPLGCPLTGAHGHADLLSVQVSPFGAPCIVDPGTYVYAAGAEWRRHFRGTSAHSTVVVDGQGQAEPMGPFTWRRRPCARLHRFLSTPAFELADASHDGYRTLRDEVVHRRRVAFVRSPGYWVIADDLAGGDVHRIELRFQFDARIAAHQAGDWVRATDAGGHGLLVRAFATQPLETRIVSGSTSPIEGWVSPHYGQRLPAPVLVYGVTAQLPLRVLTLLLPVDGGLQAPSVQQLLDPEGLPCGLLFEGRDETLSFEADGFNLGGPACTA